MGIKPQQKKIFTCQQYGHSFLVECLVSTAGLFNCSSRRAQLRILTQQGDSCSPFQEIHPSLFSCDMCFN